MESDVFCTVETFTVSSVLLNREVLVDCYLPRLYDEDNLYLLLINDGQDLRSMKFEQILHKFFTNNSVSLMCVGIHCSNDRKNEYGVSGHPDYKGRGARAGLYSRFVLEELLPFIRKTYSVKSFKEKTFAGFSLGGLSALSIVWNHPTEFTRTGVFSGSLWWRSVSTELPHFDESKHLIMHNRIRSGEYYPWLKFFFEVGILDETADRNHNGIIDAIDDTVSLIGELYKKGYKKEDIHYLELEDGTHDVQTWARAFPNFLNWAWGKKPSDAMLVSTDSV
jgi:enterochelin esterase-like enzyme